MIFPLLWFGCDSLAAGDRYGPYSAEVIKVIDGDTVKLKVAIWPGLAQEVNLRLAGVNTPEKRGAGISECEKAAAQGATNFTQKWLAGVKQVTVSNIELGKYAGRALGNVSKNGEDLGQALIKAGHAQPYSGGKREKWC